MKRRRIKPSHSRGSSPATPEVSQPQRRPDDGNAFFPDPGSGKAHAPDDLAESLAEEYLQSATSGEEEAEEAANAFVPEEAGGPFIVTTAKDEFARGTDPSNPKDAERAPFPNPWRPVDAAVESLLAQLVPNPRNR